MTSSARGLDAFNGLVASLQVLFGPFIALHLGGHGWTQAEIGLALTIATIAVLLTRVPGGALVDAAPDARRPARLGLLGLLLAALVVALWPARLPVYGAMVIQGSVSSVIGPAIAAISLALVGRKLLGERLGQNARFASIGAGLAAAAIGMVGGLVDGRLVFAGVAALAIPAWLALGRIGLPANHRPERAPDAPTGWREVVKVLRDPRLAVFATCACLFHLANEAMMPLSAAALGRMHVPHAALIVGSSILLPQIVVILFAPWVGRYAEERGRRPLLLAGWGMLPVQAGLLAVLPTPWLLPGVFLIGGISGAVFAVMLPLIAADLTRGTRRFTLCLGGLGVPVILGDLLSTVLGGLMAHYWGERTTFLALGAVGLAGTALVWLAMPETRQEENGATPAPAARTRPAATTG